MLTRSGVIWEPGSAGHGSTSDLKKPAVVPMVSMVASPTPGDGSCPTHATRRPTGCGGASAACSAPIPFGAAAWVVLAGLPSAAGRPRRRARCTPRSSR